MPHIYEGNICVHVGYHKTATTFLQKSLFSQSPPFHMPWTIDVLDEVIARPDPFTFDVGAARSCLVERAAPGAGAVVVSHEDLAGHPLHGGLTSENIGWRLEELFPKLRVLIVIREQKSIIASMYKQYVRAGGALKFETFAAPLPNERRQPSFRLDYYAFDRLVGFYMSLVGNENVTVLPFELLRSGRDEFLERVCKAVGVDEVPPIPESPVNVGTSAIGTSTKRRLNKLFVRDSVNPAPLLALPQAASWTDSVARRIDNRVPHSITRASNRRLAARVESVVGDRFAASNRRLADMIELDLAELGYDVGSPSSAS